MLTVFLTFSCVVSIVLLLVFSSSVSKTKYGFATIIVWVLVTCALGIGTSISATYAKPFVGSAKVLDTDYASSRSKAVGSLFFKSTHYIPECYSVVIAPVMDNPDPDNPSDWIRSTCIPKNQWESINEGDIVDFGYDKKRHKYWGNYLIGLDEPLRSENGKFRTYCDINKKTNKTDCETIPEAEYFKRTSEDNIASINEEGFRERQQEFIEWKKEAFK